MDLAAKLIVDSVVPEAPAHIQSLTIDSNYGLSSVLTLWNQPLSLDEMYSLRQDFLRPDICLSIRFVYSEDCITDFLERIPLSGVRSAHFAEGYSGIPTHPISIQHVATLMPQLESLSLRYEVYPNTRHGAGSCQTPATNV